MFLREVVGGGGGFQRGVRTLRGDGAAFAGSRGGGSSWWEEQGAEMFGDAHATCRRPFCSSLILFCIYDTGPACSASPPPPPNCYRGGSKARKKSNRLGCSGRARGASKVVNRVRDLPLPAGLPVGGGFLKRFGEEAEAAAVNGGVLTHQQTSALAEREQEIRGGSSQAGE